MAVPRQQPGTGDGLLPVPVRRIPRSLDEALRTGPFHVALRYAIAGSGLNLDGLRRRLAAEGTVVSLSALSYWQRGRRRPERPESVNAVLAIERVLGLRRSSLVALLGPPRPRGRWSGRARTLRLEETLGPEVSLAAARWDLDTGANSRLRHLSVQYDRRVGAGRTWIADRARQVVTALTADADRFVVLSVPENASAGSPAIQPVSGCRLGRIRADPETGLHAAELLFDLRLRTGQVHVFEYEQRGGGAGQSASLVTCVRHPIRELIMRAHFAPQALPACSYHIRCDRYGVPFRDLAELPLAAGTVNLVSLDVPSGIEGIRWEWE